MTANQSVFADNMSRVVVRESSDSDSTNSDEELVEMRGQKDFMYSAKRLIQSSDKTDRRFFDIFKVR